MSGLPSPSLLSSYTMHTSPWNPVFAVIFPFNRFAVSLFVFLFLSSLLELAGVKCNGMAIGEQQVSFFVHTLGVVVFVVKPRLGC